jgi:hypothetical protein
MFSKFIEQTAEFTLSKDLLIIQLRGVGNTKLHRNII